MVKEQRKSFTPRPLFFSFAVLWGRPRKQFFSREIIVLKIIQTGKA